jgi:membrane fusion protein
MSLTSNSAASTAVKPFRHPAQKPTRWMGEILLAQPLSTVWLAWLSVLISATVATALFTVSYTRKERVTGQLTLDKGLVKIYTPPISGIVTKKLIQEGDKVVPGQALFAISIDRVSSSRGDTQAEILRKIDERKKHIQDERDKQMQILQRDELTLGQRLVFLKQEINMLTQEIATMGQRLRLNKGTLARNKELLKQEYVSAARVDEFEQEVLDQQLKQQVAERNLSMILKEQNQVQSDLANLPLTMQNKRSEFDRLILALEQETTDSESRRELVINAPQAGQVTTILVEVGQTTQPDKPLASLLPNNAKLLATLYLPSRAYGFIEKNLIVLLRYPAYPYQKFGQYSGKVLEVGRSALTADELAATGQTRTEQLYRVLVSLENQSIQAYGRPIKLQDGTQVEADILIDTRKLYEWALEPLYSVTGKF